MHPSRLRLGPSQSRPLTDASPGSARSPGLRVCRAAPSRRRNIHTHAPFRTERQSFLRGRDMRLTISRKQRVGPRRCPPKAEVTGSNPVGRTNIISSLGKRVGGRFGRLSATRDYAALCTGEQEDEAAIAALAAGRLAAGSPRARPGPLRPAALEKGRHRAALGRLSRRHRGAAAANQVRVEGALEAWPIAGQGGAAARRPGRPCRPLATSCGLSRLSETDRPQQVSWHFLSGNGQPSRLFGQSAFLAYALTRGISS